MHKLADLARELAIDVGNDVLNEMIGLLPGFSEYADMIFWMENVAIVIQALLNLFRNDDDKVKENNYGFSKDWLSHLKGQPEDWFLRLGFDGGSQGDFSLFLKHRVWTHHG